MAMAEPDPGKSIRKCAQWVTNDSEKDVNPEERKTMTRYKWHLIVPGQTRGLFGWESGTAKIFRNQLKHKIPFLMAFYYSVVTWSWMMISVSGRTRPSSWTSCEECYAG